MPQVYDTVQLISRKIILLILFILTVTNHESHASDLQARKELQDSMNVYAERSSANEAANKYREAYHLLLRFNALNDSLFALEKEEALEALKNRYRHRENQSRIDSLMKEKERMELEAREEKTLKTTILLAAGILFLPAIIVLFVYRQKLKSEKELAVIQDEANARRISERAQILEKETMQAGIEAQEKEREKVAAELHDHVALSLEDVKTSLAEMVKNDSTAKLSSVLDSLESTYQEVRTLSHHLAPPALLMTDLTLLLKKYLNEVSNANDLDITLSVFPEDHFSALAKDLQNEVYRIIQECIGNIAKHAHARHVDLSLTGLEGGTSLMIEDDGRGFDPASLKKDGGLHTIRSRVNLMNGHLEIDSVQGRGTVISIEFPHNSNGIRNDH